MKRIASFIAASLLIIGTVAGGVIPASASSGSHAGVTAAQIAQLKNHQYKETSGSFCVKDPNGSTTVGTAVVEGNCFEGAAEDIAFLPTQNDGSGVLIFVDVSGNSTACVAINTSNWVNFQIAHCTGATGINFTKETRSGAIVFKNNAASSHYSQNVFLTGENILGNQFLEACSSCGGFQRFDDHSS